MALDSRGVTTDDISHLGWHLQVVGTPIGGEKRGT